MGGTVNGRATQDPGDRGGIGAATSAYFHARGDHVLAVDVRPHRTPASEAALCDLREADDIARLLDRIGPGWDALAYVAGIPGTAAAGDVLRVNYLGMRLLTEGMLPLMNHGGAVVSVASVAAVGWQLRVDALDDLLAAKDAVAVEHWQAAQDPAYPVYSTSKQALVRYTKRVAGPAWTKYGVRINTVSPGPIETPILGEFEKSIGKDALEMARSAVGRHGTVDDVVPVIAFLPGRALDQRPRRSGGRWLRRRSHRGVTDRAVARRRGCEMTCGMHYCNIYSNSCLSSRVGWSLAVDPHSSDSATVDRIAEINRDPYPVFADMRRRGGVLAEPLMDYSRLPDGLRPTRVYSAVSFDTVNQILRDGRAFSSAGYDTSIGLFIGKTILAMEGRAHREHRNLISAAFKSKSLSRWEPMIVRPVCNALIDEFADAGRTDLVRKFTFEFPTRVISRLLGLPEDDLSTFRRWAIQLISYNVDYRRAFQASAALKEYFLEQIEQRRAHPTEDIIGDLVAAEIDGEKLTDEAIYSFLRLLLPAGLETTYRSSGNLLYHLLTRPDQFAAVRTDRALVGRAIEENLRFDTPLTTVQRFTTADVDMAGTTIPANSLVDVCIGSANRDEQRWERSEEFDIFRNPVPHISFAVGEHTCLGLHLARLETRVALECLLDRLTNIELVSDDDPHVHGHPFRSPTALPVTFDVLT